MAYSDCDTFWSKSGLSVISWNCHFLITFWSENVRFWVWLSLKWSDFCVSGWSKSGTLDSEMVHREKWGPGWKMEGVLKVDISWKFKLDLLEWKWKSFKIGPFLTFWHFLDLDFWLYSQNDHVNWQDVSKMTKIAIFDDFGSKSLKSDNFTFFRNWGFIEKNEGVILS